MEKYGRKASKLFTSENRLQWKSCHLLKYGKENSVNKKQGGTIQIHDKNKRNEEPNRKEKQVLSIRPGCLIDK